MTLALALAAPLIAYALAAAVYWDCGPERHHRYH